MFIPPASCEVAAIVAKARALHEPHSKKARAHATYPALRRLTLERKRGGDAFIDLAFTLDLIDPYREGYPSE